VPVQEKELAPPGQRKAAEAAALKYVRILALGELAAAALPQNQKKHNHAIFADPNQEQLHAQMEHGLQAVGALVLNLPVSGKITEQQYSS